MTAHEPDSIVWHKSSYSAGNGACVEVGWRTSTYSVGNGNCVEVGWRTSSFSGGNGNCVEVSPTPDRFLVRDSKNHAGPILTVPTPDWRSFLRTLV